MPINFNIIHTFVCIHNLNVCPHSSIYPQICWFMYIYVHEHTYILKIIKFFINTLLAEKGISPGWDSNPTPLVCRTSALTARPQRIPVLPITYPSDLLWSHWAVTNFTRTHTYIYTHIIPNHACLPTYILRYICIYAHACLPTYLHIDSYLHTYVNAYIHIWKCIHTYFHL